MTFPLLPASLPIPPRPQRAVPGTLVALFVIIAFGLGVVAGVGFLNVDGFGKVTGTHGEAPAYLSRDVDFGLFWKVWDHVRRTHLDSSIPETKLFYGALEGMVAALGDPYSVFMDPDTANQFAEELEGSFEGIGAEIGIRDNKLVVIAPLPGTPAERAGLKPGDHIVAIDKSDTTGMAVDYAVGLIRGPKNTKVTLHVLSKGESEPREVSIGRDRIIIQVVRGEMKLLPDSTDRVAYIRVVHFSSDTDQRFRAVWAELAAKGPRGIIIDLRNNPGGFLDQAIDLTSHWVGEGGVVVQEQFTPPDMRRHLSTGQGELNSFPTVVLVNEGSASASEIMAGALQDAGIATVVGEQTFGKGTVQDLEEFADGSAVKLTVAKWFTPKGRSIDKNGIAPDITVERSREDIEADRDPQLDRALELLRSSKK